jgi:hypothetical protein
MGHVMYSIGGAGFRRRQAAINPDSELFYSVHRRQGGGVMPWAHAQLDWIMICGTGYGG